MAICKFIITTSPRKQGGASSECCSVTRGAALTSFKECLQASVKAFFGRESGLSDLCKSAHNHSILSLSDNISDDEQCTFEQACTIFISKSSGLDGSFSYTSPLNVCDVFFTFKISQKLSFRWPLWNHFFVYAVYISAHLV